MCHKKWIDCYRLKQTTRKNRAPLLKKRIVKCTAPSSSAWRECRFVFRSYKRHHTGLDKKAFGTKPMENPIRTFLSSSVFSIPTYLFYFCFFFCFVYEAVKWKAPGERKRAYRIENEKQSISDGDAYKHIHTQPYTFINTWRGAFSWIHKIHERWRTCARVCVNVVVSLTVKYVS